jgi:UDP-N-acetylmuramate dehydrogenase
MTKSKSEKERLSTFGLPGEGIATRFFKTAIGAVHEVRCAHKAGFPVLPVGDGSNCAFLEANVPAVFLKSADTSLKAVKKGKTISVTVGAGYRWDDFVNYAVKQGWVGVERLSGIPGTCGAVPVQNIGAYGASLSDVFESAQCVNLKTLKFAKMTRAACGFGYRTSIFNTTRRGEFLILSVTMRFRLGGVPDISNYAELQKILSGNPSLLQVRQTILAIRKRKLPDWKTLPNCGSFFKNPIVDKKIGDALFKKYPDALHWSEGKNKIKLSAAWLIERSGVRKKQWGKIAISPQHALVLVNRGEKNHEKLREAIVAIISAVDEKFGITLQPEPNLLNARYIKELARAQF